MYRIFRLELKNGQFPAVLNVPIPLNPNLPRSIPQTALIFLSCPKETSLPWKFRTSP